MTDQSLRRTDELLTELVELIETARALPMSSSIVVPRERVLDLLDELRETMPPEMQEARRTITARDALLREASEQAERLRQEADERAQELIDAGRVEHERLVSVTDVHRAATQEAERVRADAASHLADARAAAQRVAEQLRVDAIAYAAKLKVDADDYTDRTLAEFAETLHRAAAVAEQGRVALARRRADSENPTEDVPKPPISG
jgi:cell division septum initiation protein DivIVA